jgi:hypothetical protein
VDRAQELWIGGMAMAQVITFYIPERYKKRSKWIPPEEKGKLIDFPLLERKSA